jgi:NADH pyrophosphatase NudC (nudix superfamily)
MEFDPTTALLAVITSGIGYLMVAAGIHKSMLEWRRTVRMCPSCGRSLTARVCSCSR